MNFSKYVINIMQTFVCLFSIGGSMSIISKHDKKEHKLFHKHSHTGYGYT